MTTTQPDGVVTNPARTPADWNRLLRNLEHGARNDPTPEHRAWCRNQARVVRRRMAELNIAIEVD